MVQTGTHRPAPAEAGRAIIGPVRLPHPAPHEAAQPHPGYFCSLVVKGAVVSREKPSSSGAGGRRECFES